MEARWEGDERRRGIADAARFGEGPTKLLKEMRASGWITEDPVSHLLPHIEAAIEAGAPFTITTTETETDGTFAVGLRAHAVDEHRPHAALRAAAFALIGSFAESTTFVEEREEEFVVVTGLLDDQTHFAPHGHTVRLILEPSG